MRFEVHVFCSNQRCGAELNVPLAAIRADGCHRGYCTLCSAEVRRGVPGWAERMLTSEMPWSLSRRSSGESSSISARVG